MSEWVAPRDYFRVVCDRMSKIELSCPHNFGKSDHLIPEFASLTYSCHLFQNKILFEIMFSSNKKVMEELNLCHWKAIDFG